MQVRPRPAVLQASSVTRTERRVLPRVTHHCPPHLYRPIAFFTQDARRGFWPTLSQPLRGKLYIWVRRIVYPQHLAARLPPTALQLGKRDLDRRSAQVEHGCRRPAHLACWTGCSSRRFPGTADRATRFAGAGHRHLAVFPAVRRHRTPSSLEPPAAGGSAVRVGIGQAPLFVARGADSAHSCGSLRLDGAFGPPSILSCTSRLPIPLTRGFPTVAASVL